MATTLLVTLLVGVESGVIAGVSLSLALFLWRASRPHAAIVGRVPGTEHFRNVKRHNVFTDPRILTIRIDESLTYLNARWLEEFVLEQVAERLDLKHLILMCSAVNLIDALLIGRVNGGRYPVQNETYPFAMGPCVVDSKVYSTSDLTD